MTNDLKVANLPTADEITRRLTEVFDDPYAIEKLYPIVAESAGRQLNGIGVVMIFTQAIHDYSQGLPPQMGNLVFLMVPHFVRGLIDDEDVRSDALEFLNAANSR